MFDQPGYRLKEVKPKKLSLAKHYYPFYVHTVSKTRFVINVEYLPTLIGFFSHKKHKERKQKPLCPSCETNNERHWRNRMLPLLYPKAKE